MSLMSLAKEQTRESVNAAVKVIRTLSEFLLVISKPQLQFRAVPMIQIGILDHGSGVQGGVGAKIGHEQEFKIMKDGVDQQIHHSRALNFGSKISLNYATSIEIWVKRKLLYFRKDMVICRLNEVILDNFYVDFTVVS